MRTSGKRVEKTEMIRKMIDNGVYGGNTDGGDDEKENDEDVWDEDWLDEDSSSAGGFLEKRIEATRAEKTERMRICGEKDMG